MNLEINEKKDAHACGCGCGDATAVAKTCDCGPDCTCGCQDGKPCTCDEAKAACDCGPDCTCGCQDGKPCTCGKAEDAAPPIAGNGAVTATYTVSGMTCGHCVKAVTEEVSAIPGVTGVNVDLASGKLTVNSDAPVDFDRIVEACLEAGDYTVE